MARSDTCSQSTDPATNDLWVAGFRAALENRTRIIEHGQFAFASMYRTEVDTLVTEALFDDAELRTKLTATKITLRDLTRVQPGSQVEYTSYARGLTECAIDRDRPNYIGLLNAMKTETRAHQPANPSSKAKSRVLALMDGNEQDGHSAFYQAINFMKAGKLIGGKQVTPPLPATEKYSEVFTKAKLHFPGLLRIYEAAAIACGDTAWCVGMYLHKQGAPKCTPTGEPPVFNPQLSQKICVDLGLPFCTLLRSTDNAEETAKAIRAALHRGYTVRVGVVSGTHVGEGWSDNPALVTGNPDHYLLIIGFEAKANGIEFVFWDPDATVSPYHGGGFGHLYYVDKAHCGPQGADVHKFGRFTTAPRDSGAGNEYLKVDADGRHSILEKTPSGQIVTRHPKRYQAMMANVVK